MEGKGSRNYSGNEDRKEETSVDELFKAGWVVVIERRERRIDQEWEMFDPLIVSEREVEGCALLSLADGETMNFALVTGNDEEHNEWSSLIREDDNGVNTVITDFHHFYKDQLQKTWDVTQELSWELFNFELRTWHEYQTTFSERTEGKHSEIKWKILELLDEAKFFLLDKYARWLVRTCSVERDEKPQAMGAEAYLFPDDSIISSKQSYAKTDATQKLSTVFEVIKSDRERESILSHFRKLFAYRFIQHAEVQAPELGKILRNRNRGVFAQLHKQNAKVYEYPDRSSINRLLKHIPASMFGRNIEKYYEVTAKCMGPEIIPRRYQVSAIKFDELFFTTCQMGCNDIQTAWRELRESLSKKHQNTIGKDATIWLQGAYQALIDTKIILGHEEPDEELLEKFTSPKIK